MKRILLIASAIVVVACLVGLVVSLARPGSLPVWARINTDRLPSWARPGQAKTAPTEAAGLFCKEHGVPERFCTLCHAELKDKLLLCKEHGDIPENICTLCHAEVQKKYQIEMCLKGHGLPKHFCVECGTAGSVAASGPDDGWCATHNTPEALCKACLADPKAHDPDGPAKVCRQPLPTVRLASPKLVRQVGIRTAVATEEEHAHQLVANAETAYDANHYAEVTPRVGGVLREVRADLGKAVRRGEVLTVLDSAEVGSAKSQYLSAEAAVRLARSTAARTQSLAKTDLVPRKDELMVLTALTQAQASARDAEQKLRTLGFGDAELAAIVATQDTTSLLDIVAPIDGTVVARHAVRGEAVQATTSLFSVADTSRTWLWIDVYESDMAKLRAGQPVSFAVSGTDPEGAGHASLGQVTWIGTEVNDTTRATRVRAELANPEGRLRANQFGQATIQVGASHKAVVIPKAAVQRKDKVDLVFIPQDEGVYRPQRVLTKPTERPDVVEVTWGLEPGRRVVTEGAFWLKTEIMKGAIGAGCCD